MPLEERDEPISGERKKVFEGKTRNHIHHLRHSQKTLQSFENAFLNFFFEHGPKTAAADQNMLSTIEQKSCPIYSDIAQIR
jgi:hypothetical protein